MSHIPSCRSERLAAARRIELTPLAKASAGLAAVTALVSNVAIRASVRDVFETFGAFVVGASEARFFLLNHLAGGCLVLGAAGLLARRTWGWWAAFAGAVSGLGDMVRIYGGLFAIIDPDHPRARDGGDDPADGDRTRALFAGLTLLLRPMRETYCIRAGPGAEGRARHLADRGQAETRRGESGRGLPGNLTEHYYRAMLPAQPPHAPTRPAPSGGRARRGDQLANRRGPGGRRGGLRLARRRPRVIGTAEARGADRRRALRRCSSSPTSRAAPSRTRRLAGSGARWSGWGARCGRTRACWRAGAACSRSCARRTGAGPTEDTASSSS